MAKYKALADTWLSHECRTVKEGEVFETTFPNAPDGKTMRLGSNLELVKEAAKKEGAE